MGADVLVIGAGVSGLTTAIALAESRRSVRVIAEQPSFRTTSASAGAAWGPYMASDPRMVDWSRTTRLALEHISRQPGRTGVRLVHGLETDVRETEAPSWAIDVPDFRLCRPEEVPDGYTIGWRYTIPVVNMRRYLDYLNRRLAACGVTVEIARVRALEDWADAAPIIVNCTGLASRELVPDPDLFPTRGQLLVVENNGIDWFFQDNTYTENLTYFFPHGNHVVLGGCAVDHATHLEPDQETAAAILKRCAAIEPRLLDARKIEDRVGLRPTRGRVRTERVEHDGFAVIHNYGHGGAGLTLSWGCAEEVRRLAG
jgi:D-amino-acid oxidase